MIWNVVDEFGEPTGQTIEAATEREASIHLPEPQECYGLERAEV